jgi:hypothetical protein
MSVLGRRLLCSLVVAVVALAAVTSAFAAQMKTPPPDDPSYIHVLRCATNGGVMTVPANTPLTAVGGYFDVSPEAVMSDVHGGNVVTVNGQAVNLNRYWGGVFEGTGDPQNPWGDFFFVPAGALAVGQSETLSWTGVEFTASCTVTGA